MMWRTGEGRAFPTALIAALAAGWIGLAGCESQSEERVSVVQQESVQEDTVESDVTVEEEVVVMEDDVATDHAASYDVWLPAGFHALEGHFDPQNPEDHYHGWPRYIVSDTDNMMMAYVPTQTLTFGGGQERDEIPSRVITVPHFYMDLHEVTNHQYGRFCRATGHSAKNRYWVEGVNGAHPVRAVTWNEADAYATWAGKSLPTEAQWEAAARGSDQRIYPWGNETQVENAPYLCNSRTGVADFDGHEYTAPVLTYAAGVGPFGHFNLAGNVAEWCYDWYDLSRYAWPTEEDLPFELNRGAKPFGQRNYPNAEYKTIRESFVGPADGSQRVVRGGSFADTIEDCRVDTRMGVRPEARQHHIGFRCVLTLPVDEVAVANHD